MKARSTDPNHKRDLPIFDENDKLIGLVAYKNINIPLTYYSAVVFHIFDNKLIEDLKGRAVKVSNPFYGKGVEGLTLFWKELKEVWETKLTEEEEILILSKVIWRNEYERVI